MKGKGPPPPPAPLLMAYNEQGNIRDWSGLCCSAARQNNELKMVAMTICLCHGGICEVSIRCSCPPRPPAPTPGSVRRDRETESAATKWDHKSNVGKFDAGVGREGSPVWPDGVQVFVLLRKA